MTTKANAGGQDNSASNTDSATNEGDAFIHTSLDDAAYEASLSQAPSPVPTSAPDNAAKSDDKPHAADSAIKEIEDQDANNDKSESITEETSVRELSKLSTEELQKFLDSDEDIDLDTLDKSSGKAGEGKGDDPEGLDTLSGDKGSPTIPKPRFDEVNARVKEKEDRIAALEADLAKSRENEAYLRGLSEGRKSPGQGGDSQGDNASKVDPIKQLDTKLLQINRDYEAALDEIITKFDDGDINMKTFELEKRKLGQIAGKLQRSVVAERQALIEERNNKENTPDPKSVVEQINANPRLRAATEKLVEDNPWINHVPPEGVDMLYNVALIEMEKRKIPNEPTAESTYQLRKLMFMAGKKFGFDKINAASGMPGKVDNLNAAPGGDKPTVEQRKEKLELANQHPAAPGTGGTNAPTDTLNHINYDTVSVRELANMLPTSQMQKMLEG